MEFEYNPDKSIANEQKLTSKEFDNRFDKGEDMGSFLNTKKAKTTKHVQRINIDFPVPFLKKIEKEAKEIGVARTALIKLWIAERLEKIQH